MSTFSRMLFRNLFILLIIVKISAHGQDILPPVQLWNGKSTSLIVNKNHPWITPVEKNDFRTTPPYEETMAWLEKLCKATTTMRMISIGKTAQGRDINMVIATNDKKFDKLSLSQSTKPLLLAQAGIHAGEIDGKDAGMMLLRDIAFGSQKELLKNVNILFVPILNADGHERSSPYNRVNQRGPDNMGWRANARNLNLNRDYAKLDSEEIRAIVAVMNDYDPELYLDLHVTDGADYQYDITYGFAGDYSPASGKWLLEKLKPAADKQLQENGHIPGPLMFAANDRDFSEGNAQFPYSTRFSNNYGDARHLPSILVENHSLKPFKQRVLGTYVFLKAVIETLASDGGSLQHAIKSDRALRNEKVVITWKRSDQPATMTLLGIESQKKVSLITNKEYVEWTGKPVTQTIPFILYNAPDKSIKRPKAYWIPSTYKDVIERLRAHGIIMESVNSRKEVDLTMYRLTDYKFSRQPFEGHFTVTTSATKEKVKETFFPGSVRISTDQPLGDLIIHLLEPESPDSFFQWGFFPEIFSRTEYIEEYAIEPLARKMLAENENLRNEFEAKKSDSTFANSPRAIYEWFYSKSPYVDQRWLLYPVGIEE